MNLKDFKKVHEDEHKAILQNSNGHSFTIAKKSLSTKHIDSLKELPLHAAGGAEVKDPTEGLTSDPLQDATPDMPNYEPVPKEDKSLHFPEGPKDSPINKIMEFVKKGGLSSGAPDVWPKDVPEDQSAQPPVSQEPAAPIDTGPAPASEPSQPQEPVQPRVATPQQQVQSAAPQIKQDLDAEAIKWQQDLANGHITPETYHGLFAKKDTLGKIGTLFGLMLSGAGSGLSGQPNAVMEMMNKEIDRDMDAQKQSKANAQNFLKLHQQGALNQATIGKMSAEQRLIRAETLFTEAKNSMLISGAHHIGEIDKKIPANSPLKPISAGIVGKINQGVAAEVSQNNAAEEAKFKANNEILRQQDAFVPGRAKLAESNEAHHVTQFGNQTSNRTLDKEDRNQLTSGIDFDKKLSRFIDWTKGHSGSLNPKSIATGKAMAAELQGAYRQATHGGVYKEGEQNFIGKIIKEDPTEFFNKIRVLPQLNALQKEHQARMSNLSEGMGLDYSGVAGGSGGNASSGENQSQSGTIKRLDPLTGKEHWYDAKTKKPVKR